MIKPLGQMSPREKAALVAQMKRDFAAEEFFTGVLGNRNSFFVAKPARRRKPVGKKSSKSAA